MYKKLQNIRDEVYYRTQYSKKYALLDGGEWKFFGHWLCIFHSFAHVNLRNGSFEPSGNWLY